MQKLMGQALVNGTSVAQAVNGQVEHAVAHWPGNPVLACWVGDGTDGDIADRADSAEVYSPLIYRAGHGNAVIACRA